MGQTDKVGERMNTLPATNVELIDRIDQHGAMMKRALAIIVGAVLLAAAFSQTASANARDPDGSRMQARQISVGSATRDRLAPPRDSVDWHYFKLSSAREVTISLTGKPGSVTASMRVTNAVGKSVGGSNTQNGSASMTRRLDPGIYYVSVSSSNALSYTLSVK